MKKVVLMSVAILLLIGCDGGFWEGAAAGTAGTATLKQWQINLQEKKAELATQYEEVLAELKAAPDPNAVALIRQKLVVVQNAQTANEGALFAVDQILQLPTHVGKPLEGKQDAVVTGLIGLAMLALREWQKRKEVGVLSNKYIAMKVGKAKLLAANPEAEKQLHQLVGEERVHLGL